MDRCSGFLFLVSVALLFNSVLIDIAISVGTKVSMTMRN